MVKRKLKRIKTNKAFNKMFNKKVIDKNHRSFIDNNHLWENQFLTKFHGLISKKD